MYSVYRKLQMNLPLFLIYGQKKFHFRTKSRIFAELKAPIKGFKKRREEHTFGFTS